MNLCVDYEEAHPNGHRVLYEIITDVDTKELIEIKQHLICDCILHRDIEK